MSQTPSLRRVPLNTIWIKGIRTTWQLRWPMLSIWLALVVLPTGIAEFRLEGVATSYVERLLPLTLAGSGSSFTEYLFEFTQFIRSAAGWFFLEALSLGFGWSLAIVVVNEHFSVSAPHRRWAFLLVKALRLFLPFGFFVLSFSGAIALLGVSSIPFAPLLAQMLSFALVLRCIEGTGFARSCLSALTFKFATAVPGGKFSTLIFHALNGLMVGAVFSIILFIREDTRGALLSSNSLPAHVPFAASWLSDSLMSFFLLLIPVMQTSYYHWISSIPALLKFEPARA